jgi:hypothetical protein
VHRHEYSVQQAYPVTLLERSRDSLAEDWAEHCLIATTPKLAPSRCGASAVAMSTGGRSACDPCAGPLREPSLETAGAAGADSVNTSGLMPNEIWSWASTSVTLQN